MQFCFEFNLNRNRQNKSLWRTFDNNKIFLPAGELVAIVLLQSKLTFQSVITIITSPWTNWHGHATLSPWWAHYFRPLTSWRTRQILLGKGDYILKFFSFLFCFIIRWGGHSICCYLFHCGFFFFFPSYQGAQGARLPDSKWPKTLTEALWYLQDGGNSPSVRKPSRMKQQMETDLSAFPG